MIPQRNISLLSNRLARQGGRRIPEAVLERDYCLAWFLYDLWYLTSKGHVDLAMLLEGIQSKLEFRGLTLASAGVELDRKESRYKRLWSLRLAPQMVALPDFDDVNRSVRRSLRKAGLAKK